MLSLQDHAPCVWKALILSTLEELPGLQLKILYFSILSQNCRHMQLIKIWCKDKSECTETGSNHRSARGGGNVTGPE